MKHIVDKALIKPRNVSLTFKTMHTKTGDICKISQEIFKELEDKSIHNVLNICKELLDTRNWKLSVIAFDFAYRIRKQHTDMPRVSFRYALEKMDKELKKVLMS